MNPQISIIIPAFNEEARIELCLHSVSEYLSGSGMSYEIIVSDDGSSDGTKGKVERLMPEIVCLKLLENRHSGKGGAVAAGVLVSKGDLVLFTDVDLSTPIKELESCVGAINRGADIAIASRDLPESRIEKSQSWLRELLGKLLNRIIQFLYLPGVHDTQCGFKLFKGDIARELFSQLKISGFLFDVEVLYLAKKRGYHIVEVPAIWSHDKLSKVSILRNLPGVISDLIKIKFIH